MQILPFRLHEKNKHPFAPKRLYLCPLDTWDKYFYEKGKLDKHMLTHIADSPFEYPYCEKTFTSLVDQRHHEQKHIQEM
jgi:hypothetical protein